MNKGPKYTCFVYFLCFSFLLLVSGFPRAIAEAKGRGFPIGEMISSGEVKFEARENAWKRVEPSHFPIFQGVRIKTENGHALIVLTNEGQVEVGQNSLFSFQADKQFHLFQGRVSFRIPSRTNLVFRVGNLSIMRPLPMESANSRVITPRSPETVGSVSLHSNGAVTVKSIRGPLSVQNQESVVLAALSASESVTIPSSAAFGNQGQMVAVIGDPAADVYPTGKALTEEFLGLSKTTWMLIALAGVAAAGGGIALAVSGGEDDEDIIPFTPVCP
jgi:hypothetical protein